MSIVKTKRCSPLQRKECTDVAWLTCAQNPSHNCQGYVQKVQLSCPGNMREDPLDIGMLRRLVDQVSPACVS